ncbi:hypothetical protein [Devosia sp. CN2-171]|jgi:hypothetical protein|uniref:hypothetical protein n=1 Tax=Devosia sp. CN2-171 TaxID=3400909 RepID=UPI003BF7D029
MNDVLTVTDPLSTVEPKAIQRVEKMLKQIGLAIALTVIATPAFTVSVLAQDVAPPIALPAVSQDAVLAACTAEGATEAGCKAVIAAYFAYLESQGIVGADLEAAIATLVVALAEAPVSAAVQAIVVAAIEEIGTTYATGEQAAAILQIAQAVAAGEPIQTGALGISGA